MAKIKNSHLDRYAVAYMNEEHGEQWLETHFNELPAKHACDVVNEHERENGREPKYYVIQISP